MKNVLAGVMVMGFASAMAQAADKDDHFQLFGAGTLTCQKYLDSTIEDHRNVEIWWAGYLSAMNRTTEDTWSLLGDKTRADVNKMIEDRCGEHSKELLGIAVHNVLEELYKTRIRKSPNP